MLRTSVMKHIAVGAISAMVTMTIAAPLSADTMRGSASGETAASPSAAKASKVIATSPWTRPTFGNQTVGVAYMALSNPTGEMIELTGASSPAAARVEIHTHTMDNGVMKMRKVEGGIKIAPGQTVMLQPSGLHLMLIDVTTKIKRDQIVPITLNFADGSTLEVKAPAMMKAPQMGRGSMSGGEARGSSSGSTPTN